MLKNQWLSIVKTNKDALRSFVQNYHPINLRSHTPEEAMDPFITAPNAERACETVRDLIRKESLDCPEIQFSIALEKGDAETIMSLLSSSWFGVPESTSCWQIHGFREAVDLLDDPFEEEEPTTDNSPL